MSCQALAYCPRQYEGVLYSAVFPKEVVAQYVVTTSYFFKYYRLLPRVGQFSHPWRLVEVIRWALIVFSTNICWRGVSYKDVPLRGVGSSYSNATELYREGTGFGVNQTLKYMPSQLARADAFETAEFKEREPFSFAVMVDHETLSIGSQRSVGMGECTDLR